MDVRQRSPTLLTTAGLNTWLALKNREHVEATEAQLKSSAPAMEVKKGGEETW